MKNSDRLRCEAARVRRLREAGLGDALAAAVVEEDTVLLAGPDRVVAQQTRPLDLEEQAARPVAARDQTLLQGRLLGIEQVATAKDLVDVAAQFSQRRQTGDFFHRGCSLQVPRSGEDPFPRW